jgi:hypothetical protein
LIVPDSFEVPDKPESPLLVLLLSLPHAASPTAIAPHDAKVVINRADDLTAAPFFGVVSAYKRSDAGTAVCYESVAEL